MAGSYLKRRIATAGCVLVLLLCLSACRVNNGDIGLLYGTWAVESVEIDGDAYTGWREGQYDESFFQFQNNICFVTRTNERYDYQNVASTWRWVEEDVRIELDFRHTDNFYPEPGGYSYEAPAWLLLTEPTVYAFNVEWFGEKRMKWSTVNTEGQHIEYTLKKTF